MNGFRGTPEGTGTPASADNGPAGVGAAAETTQQSSVQEGSSSPSHLLELAAATADQLVSEAKSEAESLVNTARTEADAIRQSSRTEADQVAAELDRKKQEQTAELDRERATALAGLEDEKAALEERIATLTQMQSDHRRQMEDHLKKQLAMLDAAMPETTTPENGH